MKRIYLSKHLLSHDNEFIQWMDGSTKVHEQMFGKMIDGQLEMREEIDGWKEIHEWEIQGSTFNF